MIFIPKPQEIYKHFKGNLYQIVTVAEHTETGEQLVVYQALYGDFKAYARPLSQFCSRVDRKRYPNAAQEFRFELQDPEAQKQRQKLEEAAGEPQEGTGVTEAGKDGGISGESGSGQDGTSASAKKGSAGTSEGGSGQAGSGAQDSPAAGVQGSAQQASENAKSALPPETETDQEEPSLDPMVLEFLDADDYRKRLNILAGLHHRITDEMITTMAIACDIELGEGDMEERYAALKNCLQTLERYECNRIR